HRVDVYGLDPRLATSSEWAFGGFVQLEDQGSPTVDGSEDASGERSINSRPNPLTGTFHCSSEPYYLTDPSGIRVARWFSPYRVGRVKGPEGQMWGVNQYACMGRIDPGYRYMPVWSGNYQVDDCGTNNIPNRIASPARLACPDGNPGIAY